ncbi:hypothetical protein QAD02_010128 [Eretmocerus hayati]|uniref:Uncharacterized protein n=1 Tax=Eretmocerus hayati TaxID=131215 RepID=A0ACC2NBE7_9HYME|nr:hypothetical protein QAD02_010128 [Eretmocerus hayati]
MIRPWWRPIDRITDMKINSAELFRASDEGTDQNERVTDDAPTAATGHETGTPAAAQTYMAIEVTGVPCVIIGAQPPTASESTIVIVIEARGPSGQELLTKNPTDRSTITHQNATVPKLCSDRLTKCASHAASS